MKRSPRPNIQNVPLRTATARRIKEAYLAQLGPNPETDYHVIETRILGRGSLEFSE